MSAAQDSVMWFKVVTKTELVMATGSNGKAISLCRMTEHLDASLVLILVVVSEGKSYRLSDSPVGHHRSYTPEQGCTARAHR